MFDAPRPLPSDPVELRVVAEGLVELATSQALEIEKLKHQLAGYNRHRFGSKSGSADQRNLQLRLEEETAAARITTEKDTSATPDPRQKNRSVDLFPQPYRETSTSSAWVRPANVAARRAPSAKMRPRNLPMPQLPNGLIEETASGFHVYIHQSYEIATATNVAIFNSAGAKKVPFTEANRHLGQLRRAAV